MPLERSSLTYSSWSGQLLVFHFQDKDVETFLEKLREFHLVNFMELRNWKDGYFLLLVKLMDANLFPKRVPHSTQAERSEVGIKGP